MKKISSVLCLTYLAVIIESLGYMVAIEFISNNFIHWLLFIMWILVMLLTINIGFHFKDRKLF